MEYLGCQLDPKLKEVIALKLLQKLNAKVDIFV